MFSWLLRRPGPGSIETDSADVELERFHRDVMARIRAFACEVPDASQESYRMQVLTVALAVSLNAAASRCLRNGYLTEGQLRQLLQPLLRALATGSTPTTK